MPSSSRGWRVRDGHRCGAVALDGPVDSGSRHAEQVADFGDGVFAAAEQFDQVGFLGVV